MTKIKEKEKEFIDSHFQKDISARIMAQMLYEATGTKAGKNTILDYYKKKGYKSEADGKFKKGYVGLSEEQIKNIKNTQYEKGHVSLNKKPIGASYNRSDGYKYIKVGENEWKTEPAIVWEKANGKVPEGYRIFHLDGNGLNNNLDNLMLMSNNESVTVNDCGLTEDPEINKAIILTTRLKQRMKKWER